MRNFLAAILLALACWAPSAANAATCFWVGGSATWDTTNSGGGGSGGIKWASATGGTTACAGGGTGGAPVAADNATFDGASGGGTVTVNYGGLITLAQIDMGASTGTIDFATNNNSITLTGQNQTFSGASTKTLNMGSGTWTLSNSQAFWNCATCANLTLNAGTSTIAYTGTGGSFARRFTPGGKTYATVTVASGTAPFIIGNSGTVGTLTVSPGNTVQQSSGSTLTVTTMTNISGSSSTPTLIAQIDQTTGGYVFTNSWTCDWCGFTQVQRSGTGSITATNSYDFKGNNIGGSFTIAPPSAGGGGGRIIGG